MLDTILSKCDERYENPNVENVWIALLKNIVQEIVKFV